MSAWLHSGRRRDICILLYGTDGLSAQKLKTRLESQYDQRLKPATFRRALEQLIDKGHVVKELEGVQEHYQLSSDGQKALEEHLTWIRSETGG